MIICFMNEQYLICTFLFLIMHSDQVILIRVSETHFLIEFYGFQKKFFNKKAGGKHQWKWQQAREQGGGALAFKGGHYAHSWNFERNIQYFPTLSKYSVKQYFYDFSKYTPNAYQLLKSIPFKILAILIPFPLYARTLPVREKHYFLRILAWWCDTTNERW